MTFTLDKCAISRLKHEHFLVYLPVELLIIQHPKVLKSIFQSVNESELRGKHE